MDLNKSIPLKTGGGGCDVSSKGILIFMVHRINDPKNNINGCSIEQLDWVVQYVKQSGFDIISASNLDEYLLGNKQLEQPSVLFTFDDGYYDQAAIAAPVFYKYDVPLNIALITGFIDGAMWPWDAQVKYAFETTRKKSIGILMNGKQITLLLSSDNEKYQASVIARESLKQLSENKLLTTLVELFCALGVDVPAIPPDKYMPFSWDDARNIENQGVHYFSHTHSHLILSRLSDSRVYEEVRSSLVKLQENVDNVSKVLVYPNGGENDYGAREVCIARECGHIGGMTTIEGRSKLQKKHYKSFELCRYPIPSTKTFLLKLLRRYMNNVRWQEKLNDSFKMKFGTKMNCINFAKDELRRHVGLYDQLLNVDWKSVSRLVFICKGNICRSPYAKFKATKMAVNCVSSGVNTVDGDAANVDAIYNAKLRGITFNNHLTKKFSWEDICESDLIVAMEPSHINKIQSSANIVAKCQITLLPLWVKRSEFVDPYGRNIDFYQHCFDLIDFALDELIKNARLNNAKIFQEDLESLMHSNEK